MPKPAHIPHTPHHMNVRDSRKPLSAPAPRLPTPAVQSQIRPRPQVPAPLQVSFQAPLRAQRQAVPLARSTAVSAVDAKSVDEHFLKDLMSAQIAEVSSQLDIQLKGRTAVDHIPEGLSTLSQYLLYREQLLENPYPDQWVMVMAPWQALRTNAGRASLIRKYQRPLSSLKDPERDRCARYLLSLFTEPVPLNSIGRTEFFGFIDCVLQSRLNYERRITEGATFCLEENVVGYKFRCEGFPGPPLAAQNWHMWAHATTREGATGILATGKVLPTDHAVAGLDPEEDPYSFFGRSTPTPDWEPGVIQLASKCCHSTKNCSGVVFAGLLPSGHVKGKSASVSYENNLAKFHALVHSCSSDRRWAIRFVAARIDFIFILSERAKANFPQQVDQPARRRGPKAIQGEPTLAIADGSADDSWGQWHPRYESVADQSVHSKAKEEIPPEVPIQRAPETAQAVMPEGSESEDLMASTTAFRGDNA